MVHDTFASPTDTVTPISSSINVGASTGDETIPTDNATPIPSSVNARESIGNGLTIASPTDNVTSLPSSVNVGESNQTYLATTCLCK